MEGFSKQEIEEPRAAWEAQAMVGHPMDYNFLGMVHANMIPNCPITAKAVKNANVIFSSDLAEVMGKMVRRPSESVLTGYVQIPRIIVERYWLNCGSGCNVC
jgi:hypothetical protein